MVTPIEGPLRAFGGGTAEELGHRRALAGGRAPDQVI